MGCGAQEVHSETVTEEQRPRAAREAQGARPAAEARARSHAGTAGQRERGQPGRPGRGASRSRETGAEGGALCRLTAGASTLFFFHRVRQGPSEVCAGWPDLMSCLHGRRATAQALDGPPWFLLTQDHVA